LEKIGVAIRNELKREPNFMNFSQAEEVVHWYGKPDDSSGKGIIPNKPDDAGLIRFV
jgi:hypothetical protein